MVRIGVVERRLILTGLASVLFLWFSVPVHAQQAHAMLGLGCELCHATHSETGEPYNLKQGDFEFRAGDATLDVASSSCLRCHGSYEGMAAASQQAVAGRNGLVIGPGLTDDHPVGAATVSSALPLQEVDTRGNSYRFSVGAETAPGVACSTCHDPHSRGPQNLSAASVQQELCARCHEDHVLLATSHTTQACTTCHRLHQGTERLLVDERSDRLCGSCHIPGYAKPDGNFESADFLGEFVMVPRDEAHRLQAGSDCLSCHPAH